MRQTTIAAVLLFGAMLPGVPPRGGMVGMPDVGDPLRTVADAYAAAMRAGDAAGAAAIFASDATDMPPGAASVHGRAAIEAHYRGLFASCRFVTFELTKSESRIVGDIGYLVGTSRAAVVPASGGGAPGHEETGKYLVVFRRTADGWRAAYAIHNEDGSPAGREKMRP